MPRPLALERMLTPAQQREFVERRARGATRAELRAWLAELGVHPTPKALRVAVEHADRRLARARDTFASAAVSEADRDPPDAEAIAAELAALQARAVAVVGENHPAPVSEYLLRLAELRIAERLERDDLDLDVRELHEFVETVVTIVTVRAKFPSRSADAPRQFVIPPGLLETIWEQIYGFRRTPPGSADVPAARPNGPDPRPHDGHETGRI